MCNHEGEPCTLRDMEYWQDVPTIQRDLDRVRAWIASGRVLSKAERGTALRLLKHVEPSPVPLKS